MGKTVAETIKEITRKHLTENNGLLLGQAVTAVGWVNNTVPDCEGIVELSMADIAGAGIAVGTAIVGRRPIFVVRFQNFLFLHSSILVNYAAKTKEIFGVPAPIFVRAIAIDGAGINHSGNIHSIFMHMPGFRVCSPMTPGEYREIWDVFMENDDPMIVSEHRGSFGNDRELPDIIVDGAEITIFLISIHRLSSDEIFRLLHDRGIKCNIVHILWLKPFLLTDRILNPLMRSGKGIVVDPDHEIAGASQSIAYELMSATGLKVKALGALDKSAGAMHSDSIIPNVDKIIETAESMV